jgi:hypothetical protein
MAGKRSSELFSALLRNRKREFFGVARIRNRTIATRMRKRRKSSSKSRQRRSAAEKVCANLRIWTGATPKRAVRGNVANAPVHSSEGVASARKRAADRTRTRVDAKALS